MTRAEVVKAFPKAGRGSIGRYPFHAQNLIKAMMLEFAENPLPESEEPTVTSYWYKKNGIKEFYGRIGVITGKEDAKDMQNIRGYIYDRLEELVENHEFSYSQLNICDRQRSFKIGEINPHVIAFIEKETSYHIIKNLNDTFGITVICGKGQPSCSLTEYIVDKLQEIDIEKDIKLITFVDYDPAGMIIQNAILKQLNCLWPNNVELFDAGLYPELFEDMDSISWYPVAGKEGNRDTWIETMESNNHLINNSNNILQGIELDSLGTSEIYKVLNKYIVDNLDLLGMIEIYRNEYIEAVKENTVENLCNNNSEYSDIKSQIAELQKQLAEIEQNYQIKIDEYIEFNDFEFSYNLTENMLRDYFDDNKSEYDVTNEFESEIEEDTESLSNEIED